MKKIILETERTYLREVTVADQVFILALVNSPKWLKYIGDRNVYTYEEAVEYIQNTFMQSYKNNGFGFWAVINKETEEVMGICGFAQRVFLECPDIGFGFLPEFEGMGYAYETSKEVLLYGQTELGMKRICAIITPSNKKSIALALKLGLKFDKEMLNQSGEEILIYKL